MHTYMKTPGNLPVSHELESTEGLTEIQFKGRKAYITNEHNEETCLTNFLMGDEVSCETLYIVEDIMSDDEYESFLEEIGDSFVVATQHRYWGKDSDYIKEQAIREYNESLLIIDDPEENHMRTKRRNKTTA